ncbi:CheR family methyltransferase [Ancylobacter mangrovi]|uniref:CheR family methyltransferase n=1 Tax=Ancylobacter mangrovi TaxID=2972472 RepID=UPI002162D7F6|nr:CheR family methyltransferase [Ancylobacter mangrovi]MCS0502265.1 hypothetical protein [Ancylobacter mangrovi]
MTPERSVDPELLAEVRDLFVSRFGLLRASLGDDELSHRLVAGLGPRLGSRARLKELLARAAGQPLDGPELQLLIRAITIRESSLLRHLSWFELLARHVVDPLIAARRAAGRRDVAIWSAGCSSGEEAYGLALLFAERLPDLADWDIRIIGTDLCASAVEEARRGRYRGWSLREVSPERRALHFRQQDDQFEAGAVLRALVTFDLGDLLDPESGPWTTLKPAFDIIVCRNVLMHLEPSARRRVTEHLAGRLAAQGVLVSAPSEASPELFHPLLRSDHEELLLFRRPPRAKSSAGLAPATRPAGAPMPRAAEHPAAMPPPSQTATPSLAPLARDELVAHLDALIAAGRLAEARRLCALAMERAPLDSGLVHLMATLQEMEGDHHGAFQSLKRALYIDGADGSAQLRLAGLQHRLRSGQGRPAGNGPPNQPRGSGRRGETRDRV